MTTRIRLLEAATPLRLLVRPCRMCIVCASMAIRCRALVISEDVEFVAELLRGLGAGPGCEAPTHVADEATARGLLRRDAAPDLVILDAESLGPSAAELLRYVRTEARLRRTAVLVAGAASAPRSDRQAFLPGEVWMSKPVELDDLLTAVQLAQASIAAEDAALAGVTA